MAKTGRPSNQLINDSLGTKPPYLKPPRGADKKFRDAWRGIVEDFEPDHFFESDRPVLEEYIHAIMKLERVRKEAESIPFTMVTDTGVEKKHPIHELEISIRSQLVSMSRTLRLAPSTRLQATQAPKKSKWQENRKSKASEQKRQKLGLRLA